MLGPCLKDAITATSVSFVKVTLSFFIKTPPVD